MAKALTDDTVFYSWQSDLNGRITRNLIEGCLEAAIARLGRDDEINVDPSLDRDTKEVAGAPIILDAILDKIDRCIAFVCDVSIINKDTSARPCPNPSVLLETGYAVKAVGWDRVLLICNTFYGPVERLPFDIPDRRVIAFHLAEDHTPEDLKTAREQLTGVLRSRLRDILKSSRQEPIDIQFGDRTSQTLLGHEITRDIALVRFEDFPDMKFPRYGTSRGGFGGIDHMANSSYYDDVGTYTLYLNLTSKIAFTITNHLKTSLTSPKLEISISLAEGELAAFDVDTFPKKPFTSTLQLISNRPATFAAPNSLDVSTTKEKTVLHANLETIQPQRTAWTTSVFLGSPRFPSIDLHCRVFADNLSRPFEKTLKLHFKVGGQSKSLQKWIEDDFRVTSHEYTQIDEELAK